MPIFRTHRQIRQARTRAVLRFFAVMGIVTVIFIAALAGRYLLGWW